MVGAIALAQKRLCLFDCDAEFLLIGLQLRILNANEQLIWLLMVALQFKLKSNPSRGFCDDQGLVKRDSRQPAQTVESAVVVDRLVNSRV